MRSWRPWTRFGALAALLLALGLGPAAARAAGTVDVSYDLADTDLVWSSDLFTNFVVSNDDDTLDLPKQKQAAGLISGSMQVRYASDSSSGLPIRTGPVTLESFALTAKSLLIRDPGYGEEGGLSGTLRWQLTAPATGSLTSSGALTGLDMGVLMTGRAKCLHTTAPPGYTPGDVCAYFFGVPTFTVYPSYARSGLLDLGGSAVPAGGIGSTRHTLTGQAGAVGWQPGRGVFGVGYDLCAERTECGALLVGREVLREGEGHPDKVVPEPGTLLLLGTGTAGLALVGRATRRSSRPRGGGMRGRRSEVAERID